MTLYRRGLLRAAPALAGAASLPLTSARAQAPWPNHTVAVMVPFSPGGSTDFIARMLAQELSAAFGQQFVVDNRAGGSGTVGMAYLARARPDGYTLGVVPNGTFAMAPAMYERLSYDNDTAFAPIGLLASNAMFLCVEPNSPYKTLAALIDASRAQPGRLSFASAGSGVANHLGPELLQEMAGVQWLHVPYRSGAAGVQAVIAKETTLSFVDSVTAIPYLRDRTLLALGYSGADRSPQAPDVPTIAELGYPGYRASTDFGFFAPAGTPQPVLQRLSEESRRIMLSAATKARLEPLAIDPVGGTPEQFAPYAAGERSKWGELIRRRNIKPE
ncbi:Bug family tripartite tricarboxylate transporter substrate binding protein [Pararoseomonas indoligenes]|uniref:Tripartite tricarboxylate transporter substrate binding protein n=1 Tax=Roseomonas indoligenes TaxID=2820811 RepID=A0A940N935_9PROT|nr:tripartite tricarboxylate transporter substrate binding protein [Pararoseomonas indoligenes]MBP0496297.1 tripartite tricarboxylate transporter substrate binding protein [Pararoseomonas indoligenes]